MPSYLNHPASFKDPAGFIFQSNGKYYRQINISFSEDYEMLMRSGLYDVLVQNKLLLAHSEVMENFTASDNHYKTLFPQQIKFICYPYEWCFDQLKDAALLTIRIMKLAINRGMILKDATPFNIQFENGQPVFIDTLSFEIYDESKPWIAYRQFCECFLFPLYIEHYLKLDIQKLFATYLDGIPVNFTARLLPIKSRLNPGVLLHVYLQNFVKDYKGIKTREACFDKLKLSRLLDHLENRISKITSNISKISVWNNYYSETILSQHYLNEKKIIFNYFLKNIKYNTALDLGTNNGYFARILAENNANIIAIDSDNQCINNLYQETKKYNILNILPLCIDVSNPSPATGFQTTERQSFIQRINAELVVALALVHHLVLAKNIPLNKIATFIASVCIKYLVIEFIPLTDPKAAEIVKRKSHHNTYDQESFERSFSDLFVTCEKIIIPGTERVLYLMDKK
jgi:hypothetical protein